MDFLIFLILISVVAVAVLSGMLMYQYKMKITVIEERMDKMVTIMNGMTQEMIAIKTVQFQNQTQNTNSNIGMPMHMQHHYFQNQKIEVSDDEDEDENDENVVEEIEASIDELNDDNIRFVNVDMKDIASEGSIPSLGDLEEMHSETGSSDESIQEGISGDASDILEVRKLIKTPEPSTTNVVSYDTMSVAELKNHAIAMDYGIPSDIKKMKRGELLELISSKNLTK